jgi:probable HAF family extracellular repeat protein
VSDSGRVVGTTTAAGSNLYHAFSSTERDGMVDLGTLGGDALAAAVNNRGQVVGDTFPDNIPHPSSWTQTGGIVDLGTLGGTHAHAVALNDRGAVVGYGSTVGNAEQHAVLWQLTPERSNRHPQACPPSTLVGARQTRQHDNVVPRSSLEP